jgi:hypothetical protein
VAEQFHHTREAHTGAKHLCCVCVPQLVRNDADGQADGEAHFVQIITELPDECFLAARTR